MMVNCDGGKTPMQEANNEINVYLLRNFMFQAPLKLTLMNVSTICSFGLTSTEMKCFKPFINT